MKVSGFGDKVDVGEVMWKKEGKDDGCLMK